MSMPIRRSLVPLFVTTLLHLVLGLCLCAPTPCRAEGPRVIIDSSPPGASVYIDGKERGLQGTASSTFKLRLDKGPHRVLLELDGYKPVEQVINVVEARKFTFNLERAPARLDVRTPGTNDTAKGGEVFIDGAPAGTIPVPIEVPSGRHLLEVRKPGYRVYSDTVELRAAESRTVWVTLQSEVRTGQLLVGSDSSNAEVYVDGVPRGIAPVLVDNLAEGEHQVEVRKTDPNSVPWRQTVRVVAGQQTKITAQNGPAVGGNGSLMVVTSIQDADVVVDGAVRGKANQEIGNLRPGQHVVDVRAKGFGAKSEVIEVEPGKQKVVRLDLPQTAEGRGVGILRVIMMNPVEGAQYFINGRRVDEAQILNEKGMEVANGPAIVVVRKEGFGEMRREATVHAGGIETVSIDLRNVGTIFVLSEPKGAQVYIDNGLVGQTPYTAQDVPAGQHRVELRLAEFLPYTEVVTVRGGEKLNVNPQLMRAGPGTAVTLDPNRRFSLSSFSAVTVDPGSFTADVGFGFPYFFNARVTVGALRRSFLGLDAGVELRTNYYFTDVSAIARAQWLKAGPLAIGLNLLIGGGGGPRRRNNFTFEVGLPVTLLAGGLVHLTARPYLQVYSDRNCPGTGDIQDLARNNDVLDLQSLSTPEHVGDACTGGGGLSPQEADGTYTYDPTKGGIYPRYVNQMSGVVGNSIAAAVNYPYLGPKGWMYSGTGSYNPGDPTYQAGTGQGVLERYNGVRFIIQAVVEVAISPMVNIYALIEGAPFQPDRQAFTDKFSQAFPEKDFPLYGRLGLTFKF